MFNSYTEKFRENTVSVVRAGIRITSLAKRLHIPPTTIRNWVEKFFTEMIESQLS